jgi:hypothetical protein
MIARDYDDLADLIEEREHARYNQQNRAPAALALLWRREPLPTPEQALTAPLQSTFLPWFIRMECRRESYANEVYSPRCQRSGRTIIERRGGEGDGAE